jgi:TetR/AcrR family transcriptional regulator, transcriptional repressor for nem operon
MPKANVREQLINAGLKTLLRKGFNGSGVQDIADAARVPKGSFYNHFESKEAFAAEALERYWQAGAVHSAVLRDLTVGPVERLRIYFGALFDAALGPDFEKGCMVGNFSTELSDQSPEIRERLAAIYAAWTRSVESCVREAQHAKRVRLDLPASALASFLINSWEGAVLRARVERDRSPLVQFEQVVFAGVFT